jgi:hypothetical protein
LRIYGGRGRGRLGYVNVFLMCSTPPIHDPIRLYVDTGASRTTIADRDVVRLGIDYAHLSQSSTPVVGIGSKRVENYLLRNVLLVFRVVGGGYNIERLPVVTVLKHDPQTDEEKAIIDQIPSLLGVDVLGKYRVRFTKKRVVLEK